jgi:hypothetical protein
MRRLLREAAITWVLRHPEHPCDPVTSDWPFVCNVVLAYLRHALTDYDRLVDPETRDALRAQVQAEARRQYRWLRPEIDPRKNAETLQGGQKHYKVLNEASAQLAELVGARAHLFEARRREKDKAQKALIEQRIKEVEEQIKQRQSLFEKFESPDGAQEPFIVWNHPGAGYSFGCRRLPPNYIESAGCKCPGCNKTVMQTKRPLDLGAGIKLVCLSCECMSIAISAKYGGTNATAWGGLLANE